MRIRPLYLRIHSRAPHRTNRSIGNIEYEHPCSPKRQHEPPKTDKEGITRREEIEDESEERGEAESEGADEEECTGCGYVYVGDGNVEPDWDVFVNKDFLVGGSDTVVI